MEQKRLDIMEKMPVKSAIFNLAVPTMISMVVMMIYNITDTFFIGKTGDPNLVAAISLASPIPILIQAISNIFANGSGSYISRKLGEKDIMEAKRTNAVAVYTIIGIGFIFTILLLLFKNQLTRVLGTSEATYAPTLEYLTILSAVSIMPMLQVGLSGLIRSEGATTIAMNGMIIGVGLNIVLDPIFILGIDMGVTGAAYATAIGYFVGTLYYVSHFLSKKSVLSIELKYFVPSKKIYFETFKIGAPSALSMAVMSLCAVIVNVIAAKYGDYTVAGYGIYSRVINIVVMLALGLAQGFQPFAGYNYGAKKFDRLRQGFIITIIYNTILSLLFLVIFILFGDSIISVFINDSATVTVGTQMLKAFTWCVPLMGIQLTLLVTFQAIGKATEAMIVSLSRQCIIFLPLLFIMKSLFGFKGFIFAQPIADILTTVLAVFLSIPLIKQLNIMHEDYTEILQ